MPSVIYKPPNYIVLSMPDNKKSVDIDAMRCDAMPSDDANSGILMDMSQSIQGCFVHTVWASKPINGVAFQQLSWYRQQNSALATSFIDDDTRIRITLISCLNQLRMNLLLTDLLDGLVHMMLMYRTAQMYPVPDIRLPGLWQHKEKLWYWRISALD